MLSNPRLGRRLALLVVVLALLAPTPTFAGSKSPAPRTRTALFEKMRIVYDDYGKGRDAVVLVHGWACNRTFWRFQAPVLAASTRVIALDLPGHGDSDKPEITYDENLFARSIHAVLESAGVRRAVLVGHSMGTPVVRQFYRLYPKQVRALVFADGALRLLVPKNVADQRVAALKGPAYDQIIPAMFQAMLGKNIVDPLRGELMSAVMRTPKHVVISAAEQLNDESIYTTDPVSVPVLAIFASSSGWPPDNETYYRSFIKNLDYVTWDGVGHFLMIERPDAFNSAVLDLLVREKVVKAKRAA